MRLPFQVYADTDGNLNVMDGPVIVARTGEIFRTGVGAAFSHDAPEDGYNAMTALSGRGGAVFTGGSGRNMVITGGPAELCGHYRPQLVDQFSNGPFLLVVTGPSAATISDAALITVAELTTGGTAPAGSYVATPYGEATYNSSAAFTLVAAAEEGGPGAIPAAMVEISHGTAQGGLYNPVDVSNFVSAIDPNWTLALAADGSGELRYLAEVIGVRLADGVVTGWNPEGLFQSTELGQRYNPLDPADPAAEDIPEVNPFGVLTLVFSWPASPDLDIGVTFLGETVGYGYPSSAPYVTWSGDDQDPAGSETVSIDLAAAWDDGAITTFADVLAMADWYPPRFGSGPATLDVTYTIPGSDSTETIYPGSVTPAANLAKALRITAAGIATENGPWQAHVRRVPAVTRAGVAYAKMTESYGLLVAVDGPFFATAMPPNTSTEFHFPIALSDGAGGIEQLHTGSLVWWSKVVPDNALLDGNGEPLLDGDGSYRLDGI